MNTNEYLQALANRRTIYALDKNIKVTPERLREIVELAVQNPPSAFNSQTARAIILLENHHKILWDITTECLKERVPAEHFAGTQEKMDSFMAAAATILYYEDMNIVEGLQKQFPTYADNFPLWSMQANGMVQENVWVALELEGLGASIQHYNPLIDEKVKEAWSIPDGWKLIGQMVVGNPLAPAGEKEVADIKERVKLYQWG